MKAIIQRVISASVTVDGRIQGEVGEGLLVLLGVKPEDTEKEAEYLAAKLCNLRIFTDQEDKMNLSLLSIGGEMLVVSNFTLYGDCRKGNRPSFVGAARPETAQPLYNYFMECVRKQGVSKVASGVFGAHMEVRLVNNGPVTLVLDTDEIMPGKRS